MYSFCYEELKKTKVSLINKIVTYFFTDILKIHHYVKLNMIFEETKLTLSINTKLPKIINYRRR